MLRSTHYYLKFGFLPAVLGFVLVLLNLATLSLDTLWTGAAPQVTGEFSHHYVCPLLQ